MKFEDEILKEGQEFKQKINKIDFWCYENLCK